MVANRISSFATIRVIRGLFAALRLAILCGAIILAAQTFVAIGWLRPIVVAGDSMAPTLEPGQRVSVRRWRAPKRWDVVVLRSPVDARDLLIKRVVGMPGEEVSLRAGGVWINGHRVEPGNRSPARSVYYGAFGSPAWRLGADEWFVTGDNQLASVDSRNWVAPAGVPTRLIVGVVAEGTVPP
ncbi:Signal peptidase I U [Botrimarina colliarenosi]|uniref:Signal peptidase I n=1 Tax=Botrimarina colliarenosi TaxID=2528001 RepID=A0A5C6A5U1_9BACT|nr:signal peptidase I [Botrimarina colliarenosi]TWT95352.1 Signal peptidase I U [Botrimarina colliarenosi]